ncbi:hypothetical protein DFA_07992 [Cavenderia fasciculata]|uniref:Uncharacterized protein n=1 Tax=Cavenderia fasciculata TaxID=261658 RepID=F4Q4E9_CACFS|nr:uncharacterized protein DFA_07992 [Cavenderia fasciculata]EGG17011.1 hypothetical protein DFA_07992 [Cavenderia fasciculata]|eukprot:XP_004355495.1 hypothetical protein DFA_07992 [Cavenderia fasciculata]
MTNLCSFQTKDGERLLVLTIIKPKEAGTEVLDAIGVESCASYKPGMRIVWQQIKGYTKHDHRACLCCCVAFGFVSTRYACSHECTYFNRDIYDSNVKIDGLN